MSLYIRSLSLFAFPTPSSSKLLLLSSSVSSPPFSASFLPSCLELLSPSDLAGLYFRFVFRSSSSAMEWAYRNKYFHILSRGVERGGWKFVLLARFSPMPSYIINYALAATNVGFLVDFLLLTIIGCLPMILQNTSIGSLAGAAVSSSSSEKS